MSQEDILTVIGQIKPRLVIPMHFIVPDVVERFVAKAAPLYPCLLYTSDAADERSSVDLGGRRIIKKKKR